MLAAIQQFISKILGIILSILPDSPFAAVIDSLSNAEWLGYVNYFIPVGTIAGIATSWGVAIGVFYVYQIILRWAKAIGD